MQIKDILIVEDDEISSMLLCYLIEDVLNTTSVTIKQDGEEGLSYLHQAASAAVNFPDLIFLDLNMPNLSGYDFIKLYEEHYTPRFPDTQLIVLTNSVRKKDRENVLKLASVAGFFHKPLEEEQLKYIKETVGNK